MNNYKNLQYFKKYESYFHRILKLNNSVLLNLIALTNIFIKCKKRGGKVFLLGNGGSAAIASHVAVDLTKNAGIPSVTFNEVDLITCFANDFGYENIFSRQIEGLGESGDVLVCLTTSGNSLNIIKAIKVAKSMNVKTILMSGNKGGKCSGLSDLELIIPSQSTARIQEIQIFIGHIICDYIEENFK